MEDGDPTSLYKTAEPFLKALDFASLRRHVTASPHSNSLPATQLLTLTHILSQTRPDHYSILSLPRYTNDPTRIRTQFKSLALLLNPNTNPVPLSSQAYAVLLEAYSVLSNPDKKLSYDNFLRISERESEEKGKSVFWTVCPYCYYVYEYERDYLDCCLKCRNAGCGRGFTAVEVEKPPDEVAGSGRYLCLGFDGIGFKGFSTWSPFVSEKMGLKRRKTVGVCSNKVTGKGVRVSAEEMERIVAGV